MLTNLSAELVRDILSYDENTGELRWIKRMSLRQYVGDIAGWTSVLGYRGVTILGKPYRAHRIIWLLKTGHWPSVFIDHINGIRDDNRWCNLREATSSYNLQNRGKANKSNSVGLLGVYKRARHIKCKHPFSASLGVGNKRYHLGSFATPEEAHAAYIRAKQKLHPGYVGSPNERPT